MITGRVEDDEARIRVKVSGPQGQQTEIEAVIDTGYTGMLTLPARVVVSLGLPWRSMDLATLGDGSECTFDVYAAGVMWDGLPRNILVDKSDSDPVVGMSLLNGYEIKMQVRHRGKVTIKRLPRKSDRSGR